jgi:hypothetical protein
MAEVQVRKPDVDVKQYRFVVLKNSLKALLISDPRIDIKQGLSLSTDDNTVYLAWAHNSYSVKFVHCVASSALLSVNDCHL